MSDFLKLTELANKIIETGNMDIYQETFEMVKLKVQTAGTHLTCHNSYHYYNYQQCYWFQQFAFMR